jgi:uncharacterized protein (TIGR03085 family)
VGHLNFARTERAALCDLLATVGPDEATLCEGWTTRDLAAHLVVRDRRPDAAAGIVMPLLSAHGERVRKAAAARDYQTLVEQVRRPPRASMAGIGPLDRLTNTAEFFIHHEDVRRAAPDWSPRDLPDGLAAALYGQVRATAGLRLRRFPARITIVCPGREPVTAGRGPGELTLTGDAGELTMFLAGRQRAARVTVAGPQDLADRLRRARLGV